MLVIIRHNVCSISTRYGMHIWFLNMGRFYFSLASFHNHKGNRVKRWLWVLTSSAKTAVGLSSRCSSHGVHLRIAVSQKGFNLSTDQRPGWPLLHSPPETPILDIYPYNHWRERQYIDVRVSLTSWLWQNASSRWIFLFVCSQWRYLFDHLMFDSEKSPPHMGLAWNQSMHSYSYASSINLICRMENGKQHF